MIRNIKRKIRGRKEIRGNVSRHTSQHDPSLGNIRMVALEDAACVYGLEFALPLDGVVLSAAMGEQSPSYFHVT
jgi:hypothetical protein